MIKLNKMVMRKTGLLMIVCASIFCGCGSEQLVCHQEESRIENPSDGKAGGNVTQEASESSLSAELTTGEPDFVTVFVCGAVRNEGVYELPSDARIDDALKAAGEFADGADTSAINRADRLYDGQQVYFPYQDEHYTVDEVTGQSGGENNGLVNINNADKETLMTLSGIGAAKAENIIKYREANGAFGQIEDIKNVNGIGDSIYRKIEEYITVN